MQHVTIKDIARLAGVSATTVSRALNNSADISSETRERILDICRQQGYHTNLLAKSLISSRSQVIGVILPSLSGPFYASLALHVETCAKQSGYQVMLCCGKPSDGNINELFEFLLRQRVDGILMSSANNSAYELLYKYGAAVPAVLLGASPQETSPFRINSVGMDNYMGGRMAAEYLHDLGHRDVLYLGLRGGSATHRRRHRGFTDAASAWGMRVRTIENETDVSSMEAGYRLAQQAFSEDFRETAAFAASDMIALGVLQAADEQGIPVPERLSVLGFDNIDYAGLPKIQLTTFSQDVNAMARESVRLLLELIEGEEQAVYTRKLLLPGLVERKSCRSLL